MHLGYGIFMWNSPERRSRRYGLVYPSDRNFDESVTCKWQFDRELAESLVGQRVRLFCHVRETRDSGHAGDAFLSLKPSTPILSEVITVGVGPFCMAEVPIDNKCGFGIGICPSDGREKFWLDPRVLYRLHDQTVDFHAELTTENETPDPTPFLHEANTDEAISNGDGTFQVVYAGEKPVSVGPRMERLGDGLFRMTPPSAVGNPGESFPIRRD